MGEFLAMLYDKNGGIRSQLNLAEYEQLKATGVWFDSHRQALEADICETKLAIDDLKQKEAELDATAQPSDLEESEDKAARKAKHKGKQ